MTGDAGFAVLQLCCPWMSVALRGDIKIKIAEPDETQAVVAAESLARVECARLCLL